MPMKVVHCSPVTTAVKISSSVILCIPYSSVWLSNVSTTLWHNNVLILCLISSYNHVLYECIHPYKHGFIVSHACAVGLIDQ